MYSLCFRSSECLVLLFLWCFVWFVCVVFFFFLVWLVDLSEFWGISWWFWWVIFCWLVLVVVVCHGACVFVFSLSNKA